MVVYPESVSGIASPAQLWEVAQGDRSRYEQLLRQHGYLGPSAPRLPESWQPNPPSVTEPAVSHRVSLTPDDVLVYQVASFSGNGVYAVWHTPEGNWICPCADFEYRGRERPCKHILIAMAREANHVQ
jgi:hypothetical protein